MNTRDPLKNHRLDGLESDNVLAFLALLGLLRVLNDADAASHPRVAWTVDEPPVRPRLYLRNPISAEELCDRVASGIEKLCAGHVLSDRKDLNYTAEESRALLSAASRASSAHADPQSALLAALMTDAAVKNEKERTIDPTPMCLLFGQGHQHFLERLVEVSAAPSPPPRGRGIAPISAGQCIAEALFQPWHRSDPTPAFRWDPNEDVRYALMAGDPTNPSYKSRTQHGANRLAVVGLALLTVVPEFRARRVRPSMIGGANGPDGFSFAWPIWREPACLAAIVGMLTHPELRVSGALRHLGVDFVLTAERISANKFMNFTRARPIPTEAV
jgi:hypothetical protein